MKRPFSGARSAWWMREIFMHSCSAQVGPPEECEQLLSAAGGPGQINTVVASIRGHHEPTPAAGVSYSIMVDSKTDGKRDMHPHIEEIPYSGLYVNFKTDVGVMSPLWVCFHLWPISWAIVMPRSKPVSSVITQLQSLEQAPPSCATPRTCLFPSGNTRSYLLVMEDKIVKCGLFIYL